MRRVLRLIAILIVLFGGYWAYYVFAAANPNDPLGVEISRHLPASMRQFACRKLEERFAGQPAPEGCVEFGVWNQAPAPVEAPLPGNEAPVTDTPATAAP
jgi:hypothetical protein